MKRGVVPLAPTSDYDLFETPIDHILPPMKWALSLKTSCASFMIDEDFILGLQVGLLSIFLFICVDPYHLNYSRHQAILKKGSGV